MDTKQKLGRGGRKRASAARTPATLDDVLKRRGAAEVYRMRTRPIEKYLICFSFRNTKSALQTVLKDKRPGRRAKLARKVEEHRLIWEPEQLPAHIEGALVAYAAGRRTRPADILPTLRREPTPTTLDDMLRPRRSRHQHTHHDAASTIHRLRTAAPEDDYGYQSMKATLEELQGDTYASRLLAHRIVELKAGLKRIEEEYRMVSAPERLPAHIESAAVASCEALYGWWPAETLAELRREPVSTATVTQWRGHALIADAERELGAAREKSAKRIVREKARLAAVEAYYEKQLAQGKAFLAEAEAAKRTRAGVAA